MSLCLNNPIVIVCFRSSLFDCFTFDNCSRFAAATRRFTPGGAAEGGTIEGCSTCGAAIKRFAFDGSLFAAADGTEGPVGKHFQTIPWWDDLVPPSAAPPGVKRLLVPTWPEAMSAAAKRLPLKALNRRKRNVSQDIYFIIENIDGHFASPFALVDKVPEGLLGVAVPTVLPPGAKRPAAWRPEEANRDDEFYFIFSISTNILIPPGAKHLVAAPVVRLDSKKILKCLDFIIYSNHFVLNKSNITRLLPSGAEHPMAAASRLPPLQPLAEFASRLVVAPQVPPQAVDKINKKTPKKTVRFHRIVNYKLIDKNEERRGTWREDNWRFSVRCNQISDKISFCFDPEHRKQILIKRLFYVKI
jgi:hypothetical protein